MPTPSLLPACPLAELASGAAVVKSIDGRAVALVSQGGRVFAFDNRCPHMGFPLSQGTVGDGILTCHWHHARFDLCSGGTFDLFADDLQVYPAEVRDGMVWVDPRPRRDEVAYQKGRLRDGLEQDIPLVVAKSVISLLGHGAHTADVLRIGGVFGATQRDAGWRDGLTIMTALGRIADQLGDDDRPLALYHGLRHVAANVSGRAPHFALDPLPAADLDAGRPRRRRPLPGRPRPDGPRDDANVPHRGAPAPRGSDL